MLAENYHTLTLSDAMFTVVSMKGPMFLKITETLLCFFGGENVCTCMILRFCPTDFELWMNDSECPRQCFFPEPEFFAGARGKKPGACTALLILAPR